MKLGYNNIQIKDGNQWKVAFIIKLGLFELVVMFFSFRDYTETRNLCRDPTCWPDDPKVDQPDCVERCKTSRVHSKYKNSNPSQGDA